jgi:DNA-binding NarL/FixJ family response regulator
VRVVTPDITVLIADDHPIFRKGLRQVIDGTDGLAVVAEADDCQSAIARIREQQPRVAALDIEMPGGGGLDVTRAIRAQRLPVEILFLTLHKDERLFNLALDLGVRGYVLKDSAVKDVVAAVKAVAAGQHFISPLLSAYLLGRRDRATALAATTPGVELLTSTERRVLKLLADYRTSKDIADELCVSVRTVDHHRASIAAKLDLKGSLALLRFAVEHQSQL